MKLTLFVFAVLAFSEVFAGSLFGEKETAIEEIDKEFSKLENNINETSTSAETELNKIDQPLIDNTKKEGEKNKNENKQSIEQEARKTTQTAIEKGKPLTAFDCIVKAKEEGKNQMEDTYKTYVTKVDDIVNQKEQGLKFAQVEIDLVRAAITEIKKNSINSINDAKNGISNLKNEALKKFESARKCINEISTRIPKPFLNTEFNTLKTQFKAKFEDNKKSTLNNLKKCVA